VREVTPRFKRYLRSLAFPLVALKVYFRGDLPRLHLINGDTTHVAQLAIVANGHYYGGDFKVAEDASLTSGKLEVVLIEKVGRVLRADILASVLAKRPLDRAARSFPAQEIRAKAPDKRVPVQIDGELWGHLPMSFRIESAAIRVIR
jgi:diacylglycerol kinase (ATP)